MKRIVATAEVGGNVRFGELTSAGDWTTSASSQRTDINDRHVNGRVDRQLN